MDIIGHVVTSTDPSDLRARLNQAATQAWRLNGLLELLVPYPERGGGDGIDPDRAGKRIHPPIPWHSQAAMLVLELHTDVRRLELSLNLQVVGRRPARGDASAGTNLALKAICALCESVDDDEVRAVLRQLSAWTYRAEVALGLGAPLRRLPRQTDENGRGVEPRCPWCGFQTLRFRPVPGTINCVNPGCTDDDGRRPLGWVEVNSVGVGVIRWQDGAVGSSLTSIRIITVEDL